MPAVPSVLLPAATKTASTTPGGTSASTAPIDAASFHAEMTSATRGRSCASPAARVSPRVIVGRCAIRQRQLYYPAANRSSPAGRRASHGLTPDLITWPLDRSRASKSGSQPDARPSMRRYDWTVRHAAAPLPHIQGPPPGRKVAEEAREEVYSG